jgi:hypothetical protein
MSLSTFQEFFCDGRIHPAANVALITNKEYRRIQAEAVRHVASKVRQAGLNSRCPISAKAYTELADALGIEAVEIEQGTTKGKGALLKILGKL